ncbi:MAG: DNA topoisomerase IV subunit A [Microbacteriaceae bacterium]|nr:DNA topoisomerase IV subunit A [Microbacteriaceae bacterium]
MTTPRNTPTNDPVDERITDIDVSTEMEGSFLEYALSVIYSRALPDARDGLKPVQRRILYQMSEMGLRPDKGHVKSSRVVGDVMGRLHPHGDASIYDAMVRLAQPFVLRVPLVDGHGNFGSLDDGPAAARYTEARLAPAATALVADIDEDVVEFVPNYDNQLTQPEVLPAAFPNLLVNGANGIAVGMATNMAPHNLIEVVAGARYLLEHPDASLDDLMSFIPGPDLPTGGTIIGLEGIREAYETGRGSFRTRAKYSFENVSARKSGIVITELPYLVGAEKVIEKIKDGVNSKKLAGISDVTDLTDRKNGLRLVIGIKTGFDPQAVLERLFQHTPLEDQFNINNVALVEGGPKTLGLVELLKVYLAHRISVTRRRSSYRLQKRRERLHLVEGLLIAILDIDEVIQLIRSSDDAESARARLMEVFDLSELQADYILELRLRRLTKFSRIELETERDKLQTEIAELELLLADDSKLRALVSLELEAVADEFGTPRRSLLTEGASGPIRSASKAPSNLELADSPCRILLSTTGRMLRVDVAADGMDRTTRVSRRSKHDAIAASVTTTARTEIGAITNLGRLIRLNPIDLPQVPSTSIQMAAGVKVAEYLGLNAKQERVLSIVSLESKDPIALGTKQGVVKRVTPGDYPSKTDFEIIALKDGDEVVGAGQGSDDQELVFVTSDAQLLRFPAETVRPQGRSASGMAGIRVSGQARAIFFASVSSLEELAVITISTNTDTIVGTDPGRAKVSRFSEFPAKGRGTGGVRCQAFLKGENALQLAWVGHYPALASAADGSPRDLPEIGARRDASGTSLDTVVASVGISESTF